MLASADDLVEFKCIQAMADSIASAVPPNTLAYAKVGNLDWGDFHAICLAGQMIRLQGRERAVTSCFTCNWHGPLAGVGEVTRSFIMAVRAVLAAAAARPS